ncbi:MULTISPECIES: TRAP transporter small permease [Leucobacter]|uniref:TRAP transporter small permease n=1 Tax=Leucobacter TaxID=55968 RepID=UPI000E653757|nr:TRAP transporter small permease [Leucobacter aridicollis]UTX51948.1 TRAP transporter small permease [Leucobacter aridicollis]
MLKRILRHLDDYVEVYLASAALVIFTVLVVAQVIMRYLFGSPLVWSEEIARFALVWFVWIAGSYAVKYLRHVRFNVIVDLIGSRVPIAQRVIRIVVFVLWLAFLLLMLVLSWQQVLQQVASGQVSPAARIPMSFVYFGLTLGMLLMSFRVAQHTVLAFVDIVKHPNEPIPKSQVEVD